MCPRLSSCVCACICSIVQQFMFAASATLAHRSPYVYVRVGAASSHRTARPHDSHRRRVTQPCVGPAGIAFALESMRRVRAWWVHCYSWLARPCQRHVALPVSAFQKAWSCSCLLLVSSALWRADDDKQLPMAVAPLPAAVQPPTGGTSCPVCVCAWRHG